MPDMPLDFRVKDYVNRDPTGTRGRRDPRWVAVKRRFADVPSSTACGIIWNWKPVSERPAYVEDADPEHDRRGHRRGTRRLSVDSHGDLAESIAGLVPKHRTNDVILFDVASGEYVVGFNPLASRDPSRVDQVTSGT